MMTMTQQIVTVASLCAVSGERAAGGGIRDAGDLLPAKRFLYQWQLRYPGTDRDRRNGGAPPVEAANAVFYRRRDDLLYATGTVFVLRMRGWNAHYEGKL